MPRERKPGVRDINEEMPALVNLQDSYNIHMENVTIANARTGIRLDGGSLYGRNVRIYDTEIPLEVTRGIADFTGLEVGRRKPKKKVS